MIEPLPYRKQNGFVGSWSCQMTPDGWQNAKTLELDGYCHNKLLEYINLTKDILKQISDLDSMKKYFNKNGTKIANNGIDPTLAFTVEKPLMTYTVEATGPNITIYAHKKG